MTTTTMSDIEIIGTESIKPSSPTPFDLKSFRLSYWDVITPATYIPLLMFYPNSDHGNVDAVERSVKLKKSLSETLNRFYVLAGRVDGYASIDCNDDGAEFIEARTNRRLSDFLSPPNADVLKTLLPIEVESSEAGTGTGRLLLVQATYFKCGGMSIGLCISHKVADASSLSTFVETWSAVALAVDVAESPLPLFIGASLLFPVNFSISMPAIELPKRESVTTRLVFDGSKIVELKRKAVGENVKKPTRVEAVTALIWKCAMKSSRVKTGFRKPSVLCHAVNLRKRIEPPELSGNTSEPTELSGNTIGPPALSGNTIGPPELSGNTIGPPELNGNSTGPPALSGNTIGPPELNGNSIGPPALSGNTIGSPELNGNSIGNLVGYFTVTRSSNEDVDDDLHVLVEKLRNGIEEFIENGVKKIQKSGFTAICERGKELGSMWLRDDIDFYTYSSWCKFRLYEADFGWGKPSWVSIASSVFSNTVILMDSKDGEGIEAWLTLSEEEMVEFERNEELLEFGSLNPSILI